ncbi:hypothetical protein RI129_004154 [Pyrocoelia pectoralis]|uniref:Uncharacterized protein n=1 Tax=Pyrocoelia pectoralis TaxID=417401 RepID=A0AAN7VCC2_9COLE
MIFLITLIFFIATVDLKLSPEVIVDWENFHIPHFDECVKETNVDPMVARLMLRQLHLPDENEFHCYLKCIYQRNQLLTSDESDLNYDQLVNFIHLSPELVDKCIKVAKSEVEICRKTYIFVKCFLEVD